MEESIIYNLLEEKLLGEWREAIEKSERETWFFTREQEALKELESELSEKSKKLLSTYSWAIENRMGYLYYNLNIKILNFGIKTGMDLQKAFADFEE